MIKYVSGVFGSYLFMYMFIGLINQSTGSCYFPLQLQGEFVMQTSITSGHQVQYSQINITADAIPIWGHCHKRIGTNNVMLTDIFSGGNCTRCLHIKLRSRNVIQILTEGLGACYTTEEAAEATCPKDNKLEEYNNKDKSILLYKTRDFAVASIDGIGEIKYDYCPINGKFQFVYNNEASDIKMECSKPMSSEIDNCPNGSELNVHFRGCSFHNHDITFKCLGSWDGPDNQKYVALLDTRESIEGSPKYRCALVEEEESTGKVHVAFSSDSTCFSDLKSARDGYEQLTLTAIRPPALPAQVTLNSCMFPGWTQGHWESAYIGGNSLMFKDQINFKTHSIRCIEASMDRDNRFFVFSRSQCGEEMYSCIWMKKRGLNVLEFQLGLKSRKHFDTSLCSDVNFQSAKWITQGRLERYQESPCPITGEYHGMIPDTDGLCAKLSSDCTSTEFMHYTVLDCNAPEIYEDQLYHRAGRQGRDISYPKIVPSTLPLEIPSSFDMTFQTSQATANTESSLDTKSTPLTFIPELITEEMVSVKSADSPGLKSAKSSQISFAPVTVPISLLPVTAASPSVSTQISSTSKIVTPSSHKSYPVRVSANTPPTFIPSNLPPVILSDFQNIARNPAPYHVTESSYFGGLSHFDFKNSRHPAPPDFRVPVNYDTNANNRSIDQVKTSFKDYFHIPDFKIPTASHNVNRHMSQYPQYPNQSVQNMAYPYYSNRPFNQTPYMRQWSNPLTQNPPSHNRSTRQKIPIALPPIPIPHSMVPIPLPRRMNPSNLLRNRELHHSKYKGISRRDTKSKIFTHCVSMNHV